MLKAQASLDFLMTYGWALLLLSIAVAAVVSLGILDTGSFLGNRAFGFSQVQPTGWSVDSSGTLLLKLKNNAGTSINITSISAVWGVNTISNNTTISIPAGEESNRTQIGSFPQNQPGTSYSVKLVLNYTDTEAGADFKYTDSGTINGRVN